MLVAVIDNNMGNIGSVVNALKYFNCKHIVTNEPKKVNSADVFILPGVGAFPFAMNNLKKNKLIDVLNEQLIHKQKPYLGICLGMQLLAENSEEQILSKGLNYIKGEVKKISKKKNFPVPNVGWHKIKFKKNHPLFKNISSDVSFYFDHSYFLSKTDNKIVLANLEYGEKITAAICKKNFIGVQFHPEKSQIGGLRFLNNFLIYSKKNF